MTNATDGSERIWLMALEGISASASRQGHSLAQTHQKNSGGNPLSQQMVNHKNLKWDCEKNKPKAELQKPTIWSTQIREVKQEDIEMFDRAIERD